MKKTRDASFIETDAQGQYREPLRIVAFIGGCTDTNEFNYLVVKYDAGHGGLRLENQARV